MHRGPINRNLMSFLKLLGSFKKPLVRKEIYSCQSDDRLAKFLFTIIHAFRVCPSTCIKNSFFKTLHLSTDLRSVSMFFFFLIYTRQTRGRKRIDGERSCPFHTFFKDMFSLKSTGRSTAS